MDKTNNKLVDQTYQDKGRHSLIQGGIVVFIIAITPILFYLYKEFPPDKSIWESSFFTIKTSYPSVYHLAWYLTGKCIPLLLLFIWFFTCKHWWHWIILVPIAMYSFQLWGIINESNDFDEVELFYILPLMMILIPFVYVIRAKLFAKIRYDDLTTFEEELSQKRSTWQQIKDLFR
jgi:hypothetical protein